MDFNPSVTVIIPVRNHARRINPCLKALFKSTEAAGMEILVTDMGSQDATKETVRAFWERQKKSAEAPAVLRFFETGGNTGRCHALNCGLHLAGTPYAAIVPPELEVGRHCLERLRAALDQRPEVFCARAQVREESGGHVRMYRMAALEQIGSFDERFYKGLEEEDLLWRGLLQGYREVLVRDAWVRTAGEEEDAPSLTDLSIETGNFLYLVYKNIPGPQQALNQPLIRAVLKKYHRSFKAQGREDLYEAALERAQDLCMDAEMTLARAEEELGPVGLPLPGIFCLDVQDERVENIYPLYTGLRADPSAKDLPALLRIQAELTRIVIKA